jgi:hypothetical protein
MKALQNIVSSFCFESLKNTKNFAPESPEGDLLKHLSTKDFIPLGVDYAPESPEGDVLKDILKAPGYRSNSR